MSIQNQKPKVAFLSIVSNSVLIIIKLAAGFMTGAVSIISEAIHSAMDLLASLITYASVKMSNNPPDMRHQYGHGKFENLSGTIEAALIFVAAGWIIYEAVHKILNPSEISGFLGWGIVVMLLSSVVNFFVSNKLYKVSKETDSVALEGDALHLRTDVYTSLGIALALVIVWATGWHIIDPIIAIIVALFIIKEAYTLLKKALYPLLDEAWEKEDLDLLNSELQSMQITYHAIRTRKSGNFRFLEFHLEVDPQMTVEASHQLCDKIEKQLKYVFKDTTITIHVEPKGHI